MGFHFGTQGDVGEARSKTPGWSRDRYNYHSFLYSMSSKDTFDCEQHQRRPAPNLTLPVVPPRTSSLPVLDSSCSQYEITTKASERHSAATMRAPLPADLRGRHAGHISSSSESTIDELQRPSKYETLRRKSHNLSTAEVPWMQEDQDLAVAGLRPRQYMEIPVYAYPLSPIVSRPHRDGFGETNFHNLPKSANWESVHAPAPLFSESRSENSTRCDGSTLVDALDKQSNVGSRDAFGLQRTISSGSNKSGHPINSQEEKANAPQMKSLPAVPVIRPIISPTAFSPTQNDAYSSMSCTPGLLLDALAADHSSKTSFKMSAGVGDASTHSAANSRNISDASFVSAVSSLDFPILEPLIMHDLGRTPSPARSMENPLKPRAVRKRKKLHRSITSPVAAPISTIPVTSAADLIQSQWGLLDHLLVQHRSSSRSSERQEKLSSMAISGILADITSSIADFPAKMLCLDTPCVVAIRHDMHANRTIKTTCSSAASSPVSPISPSSAYARRNAEPKVKKSASVLRKGSVRERSTGHISDMLRAQLPAPLRADGLVPAPTPPPALHTRSTSPESTATLLPPDEYSPTMGLLTYYGNDLDTDLVGTNIQIPEQAVGDGLKCPDLSAIASIFPESDRWWQSCLLAHLLAYNYFKELNIVPPPLPAGTERGRGSTFPDKAARTMGINITVILGPKEDTRYTKVLEDLERCMVRVMKSMMGKREGVLRLNSPTGQMGKGELALVRALSVVVRGMDV